MILPWTLEDWLTEQGDRVVQKRAAREPLSHIEQLIYEIWLLDTETRNGGLSQYFANQGIDHWRSRVAAASAGVTPSFLPFAAEVDAMIAGGADPYQALIDLGQKADDTGYKYQEAVVSEAKKAFTPPRPPAPQTPASSASPPAAANSSAPPE